MRQRKKLMNRLRETGQSSYEHCEDPAKWRKAARRYAKEGVYLRIKDDLDAIIV
jgi:hypothetical protein